MALLLNGAGTSAADPILNGLGMQWVIAASTMNAATMAGAWIDTVAGFPGTNAATIHPTNTTVLSGNAGSVNTGGTFTITSTTGMAVGDYIYLSHPAAPSITAGIYKVATVPNGTTFTLVSNPFGGSAASGIAYEVAWTADLTAGSSPTSTSGGGQINYYKAQVADSVSNIAQQSDTNYIENAPTLSGTNYITIGTKQLDATQTMNRSNLALSILPGWTNHGGIAYVSFTAHSVQTGNTDFLHSDSTAGEKTLSTATTNGVAITAGDGVKYGRIQFKSVSGGVIVGVDISLTINTTAPTLVFTLQGR